MASVTRDLRPRAVLDEWIDRRIVTIDAEDRIALAEAAFIPQHGDDDKLYYFGRNLHDHMLGAGVVCRSKRPVAPSKLQVSESLSYQAEDPARTTGRPEIVVGCVVAPSVDEGIEAPAPGSGFTLLFGVTNPTSRGRLAITGPALSDAPMIDPAYLSTERDRHLVARRP